MRLAVRLTPKAATDAIDGWGVDGQGRRFLKVRVRAAPIEGRANTALIAFLAKALGVAKSRLSLVAGDTSRLKQIEIDGLTEADLLERL
ncbi:DUF167 family protein [Asticcacaulis sp. AC402]|uniref:DUF167 domain-containing protein n=1 Tax=Asticcacaulis sp. AC402 TaxID=1282361 RepID=UPI0003C3B4DA|nr:DUF167 family protein [Asticcacaulis sp. AC402]ESQ77621.1 hypothetical protein ABAC402_00395 [Asticcacaulis sp. AC402]